MIIYRNRTIYENEMIKIITQRQVLSIRVYICLYRYVYTYLYINDPRLRAKIK